MLQHSDVLAARQRMGDAIRVSPCPAAHQFGADLGASVFLKLESLQRTGAFKERGACHRLLTLDAAARQRGVVTASAGNHAQGVAYHARRLGIPATVVMPRSTPLVKVAATRGYGATVVVADSGYDGAQGKAEQLAATQGLTLVHASDDPDVITGQGTIGLELLEQIRVHVRLPDVPGSLARLLALVAEQEANIVEIDHARDVAALELREASVQLVVEVRDAAHAEVLRRVIGERGFELV